MVTLAGGINRIREIPAVAASPDRFLDIGLRKPSSAATMIDALLLIGPTGAGKTPLGDLLEREGLNGRTCRHFDFGRELRRVAAGDGRDEAFPPEEVAVIRRVLNEGALLEDEHWTLAEKILRRFLGEGRTELIVLNGLPRHVGQARRIDEILRVSTVLHLDCPADTVLKRICRNTGGDRAGRTDDEAQAVRARLATYGARTAPLLDHYRTGGATIRTIPVGANATPRDMLEELTRPVRE
jgi:adenylate kinase family enzyme